MAVAVGATALVARRIGEGNNDQANLVLKQALLLSLLIGAIATVLGLVGGGPALRALGASPTVADIGTRYLQIVSLSYLPTALMFCGTAALRGAGDTRSPLYLMAVVNTINIALSWLLVNGNLGAPALGAEGSAIGSAIARSIAGVLLVALFLGGRMRLKLAGALQINGEVIRKILRVGVPSAGELFIFQSAIVAMAALISTLGTTAYAAHSVAITIESVSFLPGFGFAIAATAMVGQALGARDPELARRSAWEAFLQGGAMMTLMGLVMAAWPSTLISLITPDAGVIEQATAPLRLAGFGQPLMAMAFVFTGALRGAGDTIWQLWMRLFSTWVVRMPLSFLFLYALGGGLFGLWVAMFIDFAVQGVLALWRFQGGKWKTIKL
jgi:putative MATE family efflux protein